MRSSPLANYGTVLFDCPITSARPAGPLELQQLQNAKAAWESEYGDAESQSLPDTLRRVAKLLLRERTRQEWPWLPNITGKAIDKKGANKFFFCSILDWQQKTAVTEKIARRFCEEELGDPPDLWLKITSMTQEQWEGSWRDYRLHRFPIGHNRVWRIGREICDRYGGDARNIWRTGEAPDVLERLLKIGVGEQLSRMIVGALKDCGQITSIGSDLKADIHVRRVLGRVFEGRELSSEAALRMARKIHPPDPWSLDSPLWEIGHYFCRSSAPKCRECYLAPECRFFQNQNEAASKGARA